MGFHPGTNQAFSLETIEKNKVLRKAYQTKKEAGSFELLSGLYWYFLVLRGPRGKPTRISAVSLRIFCQPLRPTTPLKKTWIFVCQVFGRLLEHVWEVLGRFLAGCWGVCLLLKIWGAILDVFGQVFGMCLEETTRKHLVNKLETC